MPPDSTDPFERAMYDPASRHAWGTPDMSLLRLDPKSAAVLPIDCFGESRTSWIVETAKAAACPPDYVVAPLLAAAFALIGNARWPQIGGWTEPPHLWGGAVGFSGDGKTPGASCLMHEVLPEIERRMGIDHPEKMQKWKARAETAKVARETWQNEVVEAHRRKLAPPMAPPDVPPEPTAPRVKINDVTIERVATLIARACPKGLLIIRDELAGWLLGMNTYNDTGRQFWLETWNGAPYQVDRQKHPDPIRIPRLAAAAYGGIQPDRLAELVQGADDGLYARILWCWPDPLPFKLGTASRPDWAIEALDKLRHLDMQPSVQAGELSPVMVPLHSDAHSAMEEFGRDKQTRAREAGKLLSSAFGKARGQALRLSLVLELLWWCGSGTQMPPPDHISVAAFVAATRLMDEYFLPNAERVYAAEGDTEADRNVTRLARWIGKTRTTELHVRTLQRDVRLPGLTTASAIHAASAVLIEADWLRAPDRGIGFGKRGSMIYAVNPNVHG